MESDQDLIRRARLFDQEALAEVYDRYSSGIYRYAVRLLGDPGEAEECVSETFNRFLNVLNNNGGPQDHMQAYLYRIAHNWINDHFRKQSTVTLPLDQNRVSSEDDDPDKVSQQNIEIEKVRTALRLLTPDQRLVIMLKFFEGWSNKDVAIVINKPITAVKSLQHRGIQALRRILILNGNEYEHK